MALTQVNLRLTAAQRTALQNAWTNTLRPYLLRIAPYWDQLTPQQKDAVRERNPVLRVILEVAERFNVDG